MAAIEFDKHRELKFTLSAIRDLERDMGKPLAQVVSDLASVGIDALTVALVHGLKHEDAAVNRNLMMKRLESHVEHGGSIQPLFSAVLEALTSSGVFRTAEDAAGKTQATTA